MKAAPVKPGGSRSARDARQPTTARAQSRTPLPTARLKQLKTLVASHRSKNLTASWKLGKLAAEVLEQMGKSEDTRVSKRELGEAIGLIPKPDSSKKRKPDLATLYQLLKFAKIATEDQAAELHDRRVPWRAVVYWMGLKDGRHRNGLYRKMIKGLTDSEKIRKYMETQYGHTVEVRRHVDLARGFANAQKACDRLVETLRNLNDRLGAKIQDGERLPTRDKQALKAARRQLAASLKKAAKQVGVLESNLTSLP